MQSVAVQSVVDDIQSGDWGVADPSVGLIECVVLRSTDFKAVEQGKLTLVPRRYLKSRSVGQRVLRQGDLLVEMSGGSADQPTGRLLLYSRSEDDGPVVFSNFVKRMRLAPEVDSSYFRFWWLNAYRQGKTRIYEKRTTGIRNFKLQDFLENESIALPPLDEQRRIARILSTIQQAKEVASLSANAQRRLKASLAARLFSASFLCGRASTVGDVVLSCQNGLYKPQSAYGPVGIPILRINDFDNDGEVVTTAPLRIQASPKEVNSYGLVGGDILVNRVNSLSHLGKVALVEDPQEPMVFESNMMRLTVDQKRVLPQFLFYYLSTAQARAYMRSVAKRAVAQSSINQGDLAATPVMLPGIEVQQRVVEAISAADAAVAACVRTEIEMHMVASSALALLLTTSQ